MKVKTPKAKGQSSVEFLMTYGWAILIIGVAMILLWQWGFFNPTGTVKFSSLGFWGVIPADAQYRSNGDLTLSIRNEIVDADINITEINIATGGETYQRISRERYKNSNNRSVTRRPGRSGL
jgi:hypothetical protein